MMRVPVCEMKIPGEEIMKKKTWATSDSTPDYDLSLDESRDNSPVNSIVPRQDKHKRIPQIPMTEETCQDRIP